MENIEQTQQSKASFRQETKDALAKLENRDQSSPKKKEAGFMSMWFDQYFKPVSIFICLVIFFILYFFVVNPRIASANKFRNDEYGRVTEEQKKLKNQLDYLLKAQNASLSVSEQNIKNIDYIIPNEPNTPQILASLENIASSSKTKIKGIDFTLYDQKENAEAQQASGEAVPEIIGNGISFVEINLTVAATPYDSFKDFLDKIEKNIRLMDVVGIIYSPEQSGYSLTIRSYYLE